MKKERLIIIFYLLYFSWLFSITYLIVDTTVLAYYAIGALILYFIFLRERYDSILFSLVALIPLYLLRADIPNIPLWIPIAWGTTAIALRKFYTLVSK
jgi:hypothetical protein